MNILNFGSANIDFVYSLEHIVAEGETLKSTDMNIFPGGKGLNQSVALARAGAKVYHAGCFGTDGDMLIDILKDNGVDVSFIKRVDEKNGHAIIQVSNDGENSIFIYPGSNAMITEDYVDDVLNRFEDGDFLLLQNEINNIEYIVEKAYSRGMKIAINPSPCSDNLKNIDFKKISLIILNEIEIKMLSGCNDTDDAIEYFRNKYSNVTIVLTLGKNGSVLFDNSSEIFQSSFKVKAVDTTAAGDTYTGYFIAMLSSGKSFKDALRTASAASALAVSKNGAAPSIPCLKEVLEQLNVLKENPNCKKA